MSRGELNADIRSWLGDVCETIQTPIHCDLGANSSLFAKRKGLYIITTEGTMPLVDDRIVKYVPLYPEMRIQTVVAWKRGQPFGRAARPSSNSSRKNWEKNKRIKEAVGM